MHTHQVMEFVIKSISVVTFRMRFERKDQGLFLVCVLMNLWVNIIASRATDSYAYTHTHIARGGWRLGLVRYFVVENHYILSRSEFIKRVLHRRIGATYYVFIKRKHIQTLIFKWIFKRTYNHIHVEMVLQFTFAWPRHPYALRFAPAQDSVFGWWTREPSRRCEMQNGAPKKTRIHSHEMNARANDSTNKWTKIDG